MCQGSREFFDNVFLLGLSVDNVGHPGVTLLGTTNQAGDGHLGTSQWTRYVKDLNMRCFPLHFQCGSRMVAILLDTAKTKWTPSMNSMKQALFQSSFLGAGSMFRDQLKIAALMRALSCHKTTWAELFLECSLKLVLL